jgi:hypothetical protein
MMVFGVMSVVVLFVVRWCDELVRCIARSFSPRRLIRLKTKGMYGTTKGMNYRYATSTSERARATEERVKKTNIKTQC